MKKITTIVLATLLALSTLVFSGCGLTELDAEALGNQVLAEVNGEQILRKEWSEIYEYYEYMYINYYGYSKETYPQYFEELKTNVLDSLIASKIWEQKAKAANSLEYNDEQREEARKEVEEEIKEAIKINADTLFAAVEGQDDAEDYEYYYETAKEKYEADMKTNDITVESLIEDKLKENALDAFKEEQLVEVKVLEADILSAYDELVKEQKESFIGDDDKDYAAFVKAWNNGDDMAIILDSYSLVQHILIKYDTELGTKITAAAKEVTTAQTALDKLKEELEDLTDETKKTEKQAEIDEAQKTLDEKTAAYKATRTEAEADAKAEAEEVLTSVQGADEAKFIEVMIDKTEDSMNTEELAKKGYLVGNEDGMVTEFHDAAIALANDGDMTGLVATDYGFHIIRKIKSLTEGQLKYSEMKEDLHEGLLEEAKSTKWDEVQKSWKEGSTITINDKWLADY